jgi:hypothetical protein
MHVLLSSCSFRTEQVLEDSGVSVAPPERRRSSRIITVQQKVQQVSSRKRRGSDESESGDLGSEYEQEVESGCDKGEGSIEEESEKDVSAECGNEIRFLKSNKDPAGEVQVCLNSIYFIEEDFADEVEGGS